MSKAPQSYFLAPDSPVDEPFPELDPDACDFEILEGKPEWRVCWLRHTDEPGGMLHTGLFTSTAGVVRCDFTMNETVYCIEGEVSIEVVGGQTVELTPGASASFEKGTSTIWRIPKWFKEIFVLSP